METFHVLVHFPTAHNNQRQSRFNPGAWTSYRVPTPEAEVQVISCCLEDASVGSWSGSRGTKTVEHSVSSESLICMVATPI